MIDFLKLNRILAGATLLMAALVLGAPHAARADSLGDEVREFHHFLHEHPRVGADLDRNPRLVNNPRYLHDHDNLREFLHNHPRLRRELADNPGRVMDRSYAWDRGRYNERRYDDRPWYDWWRRR